MHALSGKIEVEARGILSTFSPLSNSIIGVSKMTIQTISKPMRRLKAKGATPALRFWSRVIITANPDKCWEWQGLLNSKGYGKVTLNKKSFTAHRLAWFYTYGEWPTSILLRHSCDNRKCCNPNHLLEGTHKDNMADALSRGRIAVGSQVPWAKLDEAKAMEIKRRCVRQPKGHNKQGASSISALSREFNVSRRTIRMMLEGVTWRHLLSP